MNQMILGKAAALALLFALLAALFSCVDPRTRPNNPPDDRSVSVYDHVFVAQLGKKYERLLAVKEPKIVVIGGSSVAFGLDSDLLSRYTGLAVVNFGLYATLGSKVMLDLSEEGLLRGDTVIFAPELDPQALSLYFGAKAAWQAIDVCPQLYDAMAKRNAGDLAAAYDAYLADRAEYLADGKPDPSGVYNSKNFTREGDVRYARDYNVMALGYDPNTIFRLTEEIVSDDFITYFNTYCAKMRERGVTVLFSFCPINELALAEGTDDETIAAFEQYLKERLACRVISSLADSIMDWGYFYDTNLHLNSSGVIVRTVRLIEDYLAACDRPCALTIPLPPPPGFEGSDPHPIGDDENNADLICLASFPERDTLSGASLRGTFIVR